MADLGNQLSRSHALSGKEAQRFGYAMVLDGRAFEPVGHALVRIVPAEGVVVDAKRRPCVIIDPRAGHGPGTGGFKGDSRVGATLREGHPVHFVIYPEPDPGQTLLDVCGTQSRFVHQVRGLHPESAKPAVTGNCQGGWAAMMLAAANPDGAWLVEDFEHLDPANTFFDKLWSGAVASGRGRAFDLRAPKVLIVLFASLGDDITPPQQAFNWVAVIYGRAEEIKARGRVIVGLTHENIGHLGVFVSGKAAKEEHAQIVSVLKLIEALPPGL
jgi:hypothetical protein